MVKYGKTWWSHKWLEIFNNISYSNRLPRGRSYANKGTVNGIQLKPGLISAEVQGSRRSPYKVSLSLPLLSKADKKRILTHILSSPSKLVRLISHELPMDLYDFFQSNNIRLFPRSWEEVDAKCSCPDHAVPCKHIASLIYVITHLIDQDPFVLFRLFGLDILKELKCEERTEVIKAIPSIEKLLPSDALQSSEEKEQKSDIDLLALALQDIPDLLPRYEEILDDRPLFWEKNFKGILRKVYSFSKRLDLTHKTPFSHWEKAKSFTKISLVIHPEKTSFSLQIDGKKKSSATLLDFLNQIPQSEIHQYCYSIRFLYLLNRFVLLAFKRSAFIPEILQTEKGASQIRWIPALFNQNVRAAFEKIASHAPDDLVCWQSLKALHLIKDDQRTKTAFSLFISEYLAKSLVKKFARHTDDKIFQLFFLLGQPKFTRLEHKNIPSLIHLWLSKLYITENLQDIYLFIEEQEEDFCLHLKVEEQGAFKKIAHHLRKKSKKEKLQLLSKINVLFEYIPALEKAILHPNEGTVMTHKAFNELFLHKIPALQSLGVKVILPKSLKKILIPKVQLNVSKKSGGELSLLTLDGLLNFDWKIAIGDKHYSLKEFEKLSKNASGIVRIHNAYALLDPSEVKKIMKQMEGASKSTFRKEEIMQICLGKEARGVEAIIGKEIETFLQKIMKVKPVKVPQNLNAQLRPYQKKGMQWLIQNTHTGFGSILADDMGLGKTIQVIATLLHYKNLDPKSKKPHIIICPTGLISNWQRELRRFAPDLRLHLFHGPKRTLDALSNNPDLLITSYGVVRSDQALFKKKKWSLAIIDEAQYIKNPESKVSKAVKSLHASCKIALTGTPVENRLLEYWSIFDFVNKNYLGSPTSFTKNFAQPIEKDCNQKVLERFHKITQPFILRRVKSDRAIIKDLPDKVENNLYCTLTPEQTALYNEIVQLQLKMLEDPDKRNSAIFNLLLTLKQVCNHPVQYTKKAEAKIDQSGKLQNLKNLVSTIVQNDEKVIVFTQFVKTGEVIVRTFEKEFGVKIPFLNGSVKVKERDTMVDDFQHASQTPILVISLKAGGTGLNLTAANHVVHYDLWWNPAVETQATDRAYRIGQKKKVFVHRLITSGTLEEKINKIIQSKKKLADLAVLSGGSWITQLSNEEIKDMVMLHKSEV